LLLAEVDADADIAFRHALAGEDVTLIELLVREQVAGFGQFPDLAGDQLAFAGGTTAHAAAVGKIDAGA